MNAKIKSLLCAAIASIEAISGCSASAVISYAADAESSEIIEAEASFTEAEAKAPAEETSEESAEAEESAETEESEEISEEELIDELTYSAEKNSSQVRVEGWHKDENGRIFYAKDNGKGEIEDVTGIVNISGQEYLFAANGVLKTGWRTINGKRYYFNHETGEAQYGWIKYEGNDYYISRENGKETGWFRDSDGICYLFNEKGTLYEANQFVSVYGKTYYINSNGSVATGETMVGDTPYVFGENGVLKTGWRTYDGKRYLYGADGEFKTGIVEYCGNKYYITKKDGKCTGIIEIDGIKYSFDKETGVMSTGWVTLDGKKHYYSSSGKAAVGIVVIDGVKYYFNEKGEAQTGWMTLNGELMYFSPNNTAMTGWQEIDGFKYYFESQNKPAVGMKEIGGKLYLFAKDGKMYTGWYNTQQGRYFFGKDGSAIAGFQKFTDGTHYFLSDYRMAFGWQTIEGKLYYFDDTTGVMAVDTKIGEYTIDANGVATKVNVTQQRANEIVKSVGSGVDNLYNYVRSHNKYKFIEQTRPLAEIESKGWSYFANYAMDNRFVVCYYFAALTDLLFQQAGYETRIVYGTGRGDGEHYWNQVKINGVWTNYDACNGYADVTDDQLKADNYTWTKYVNAKFN